MPPAADGDAASTEPSSAGRRPRHAQVGDDRREHAARRASRRTRRASSRAPAAMSARCAVGRAGAPPAEQAGAAALRRRRRHWQSLAPNGAHVTPAALEAVAQRRVSSCGAGRVAVHADACRRASACSEPSMAATHALARHAARRGATTSSASWMTRPARVARRQRAVGLIGAIGEAFGGHAQARGSPGASSSDARQPEQDQRRIECRDRARDGVGQRPIARPPCCRARRAP